MPHEMFRDAVVRPVSPRARIRRRLLTVFSIVLHIAVIVPIAVAQVLAVGPLPIPRQPVIFEAMNIVHIAEVPKPPPPPAKGPAAPIVDAQNTAPTVEPHGIMPEPEQPLRANTGPDGVVGVEPGFNPSALIGMIDRPAAPPPPKTLEPIRLFSGMQTPKKLVDVAPVYPPIAISARKEGIVILEAILDARGNIESVRVLRSDPLLEQAAVDAVKQWKYTPALLNGIAVPVIMTVTVNFTLR